MHDDITHIPFRSFFSVYTWNSKDNRIKQFDWFSLDVSWSNVNVDDAIRTIPIMLQVVVSSEVVEENLLEDLLSIWASSLLFT